MAAMVARNFPVAPCSLRHVGLLLVLLDKEGMVLLINAHMAAPVVVVDITVVAVAPELKIMELDGAVAAAVVRHMSVV